MPHYGTKNNIARRGSNLKTNYKRSEAQKSQKVNKRRKNLKF